MPDLAVGQDAFVAGQFCQSFTQLFKRYVGGSGEVKDRLGGGTQTDPTEGTLLTRSRHRQHVQAASEALDRFVTLSSQGSMVVDMAAEELRLAASELGQITGAVDVEDVLDKLFMDFCIGK